MEQKLYYPKTRSRVFPFSNLDYDYWSKKGMIPIGSKKPRSSYEDGYIPESDIVTMKFEKVGNGNLTSRKAFNNLILGGTGDGKSLIIKNIWYVLQRAKFSCICIDPKSTDSGRAKEIWSEDDSNLAPKMFPDGIPLVHCMPLWATRNFKHMESNFLTYSLDLSQLDENEMWMGLGISRAGSSVVTRAILSMKSQNIDINLDNLTNRVIKSKSETAVFKQLPENTFSNIMRVFAELEDFKVFTKERPPLNTWDILNGEEPKSICISYNSGSFGFMTFDIGFRIKEASRFFFQSKKKNKPFHFFLDDAGYYAVDKGKIQKVNYGLNEILNIGTNYRSLGLGMTLAIQTTGMIDENVAQNFKNKLISPVFQDVIGLNKLNIPHEAIDLLREGSLIRDRDQHEFEWIYVDSDNNVLTFFPFTPPCNHFKEVYFSNLGEIEE